jgi:hypothetical protein
VSAGNLLSDADYSEGLAVTLHVIEGGLEHLVAQELQELAAPGGFDITLDPMPSSEYRASSTEVPLESWPKSWPLRSACGTLL